MRPPLEADLLIIGAGPVGLECALAAKRAGLKPVVLEAGSKTADHVRRWGHVELFTPFSMNSTPETIAQLTSAGFQTPQPETFLTGKRYVSDYLEPIATHLLTTQELSLNQRVAHIGRVGLLKTDAVGTRDRDGDRFRVVSQTPNGETQQWHARSVCDCSGLYQMPNRFGAGGIPCEGEEQHTCGIEHHLIDLHGPDRERFLNRHTIVIGAGYSAATMVAAFAELLQTGPQTRLTWLIRGDRDLPIREIPGDSLPGRAALTKAANDLASHPRVELIRTASIVKVDCDAASGNNRSWSLWLEGVSKPLIAEELISLTGYRPDRQIYEELHVHECYATQGPIKLAASLMTNTSGDCLAVPEAGIETLRNPEPGFYLLGSKSYGRNPSFLLKTGFEQIRLVITQLLSNA